ncbi:hypothetical protein [Pseudolactococcus insecticola]|uniref:Uncharacterized protein n=1 Tax=Pseudolactococcus insecticola TaxID=2709158 RepID=A0A6A0B3A9_9LACT|nr:hypothetical protein [Lactococcus insecticola]GFH39622.1 hypothetical protein Hs20B_00200 [Lactococcus insecticola]
MTKKHIKLNFGFVKGLSSISMPIFSNKELRLKQYYELSDKERLHNDYRKSTLAIKEEFDSFAKKYAR